MALFEPAEGHRSDEYPALDFTEALQQAIQYYADAVAALALWSEGIRDTGEDPHAVAAARLHLRRLLAHVPPLPVPELHDPAHETATVGVPRTDYAALFAGASEAILVVGGDGRYRDANPAACRLLGYELDELLGRFSADMVVPGAGWYAESRKTYWAEGEWRGRIDVVRKDGTLAPVDVWSVILPAPDGPIHVSFLRDRREDGAGRER